MFESCMIGTNFSYPFSTKSDGIFRFFQIPNKGLVNSMFIHVASIVYMQTALFGYINLYPDYTLIILRMHIISLQNKMSLRNQCATSINCCMYHPCTCGQPSKKRTSSKGSFWSLNLADFSLHFCSLSEKKPCRVLRLCMCDSTTHKHSTKENGIIQPWNICILLSSVIHVRL